MTIAFPASLADDARYVSPAFLRTPLRAFMVSCDKGIYWLRMPADTGKTQFVRGIIAQRTGKDGAPEGIDSAISSGMGAVAVGLESGAGPRDLVAALKVAFDATFGLDGTQAVPDIRFDDAEGAKADFSAWLAALRDLAVAKGSKRLIVCIDGLEAMEPPGAGQPCSIAAMLPDIKSLPAGVVLLLTSRPREDWPAAAFEAVAAKFPAGSGVGVQDVTLDDPTYVDALKRLFHDRLRPVLRGRAMALLQTLLETRAEFERGGRDPRLTSDPVLRDTLKDDWKKLTNKYPRYSGLQLPVAPLSPLLDQFDGLWVAVMDRADRRFRYVFLLLDRLVDASLAVEDVAGLPRGAELPAALAAERAPVPVPG